MSHYPVVAQQTVWQLQSHMSIMLREAKHLTIPPAYEIEILRLVPQNALDPVSKGRGLARVARVTGFLTGKNVQISV